MTRRFRPAPALPAVSMLTACGPNDVALGAFQYGSNLGATGEEAGRRVLDLFPNPC